MKKNDHYINEPYITEQVQALKEFSFMVQRYMKVLEGVVECYDTPFFKPLPSEKELVDHAINNGSSSFLASK